MVRFRNLLREEVYRIFHTPTFLLVLSLLILLVIVDGVIAYWEYCQNLASTLNSIPLQEDGTFSQLPFLQTKTLYNSWIGGHPNSALSFVFIYTIPVYAAIAYSWMYLSEEHNGYLAARTGKLSYFFSKHLAVFLAGALVVLIPMLVSLLFTACLIPAYKPRVDLALYYQVGSASLLREMYYSYPLGAVACNMAVVTVFAGLWSTVPLAVSYFVKNRFIALFAPYLVLLFLVVSAGRALVFRSYLATSIFDYLQLTGTSMSQSVWMLLGQLGFLLVVPLTITWIKGAKADVL